MFHAWYSLHLHRMWVGDFRTLSFLLSSRFLGHWAIRPRRVSGLVISKTWMSWFPLLSDFNFPATFSAYFTILYNMTFFFFFWYIFAVFLCPGIPWRAWRFFRRCRFSTFFRRSRECFTRYSLPIYTECGMKNFKCYRFSSPHASSRVKLCDRVAL